ncbi:hypothetical protein ACIOEX_08600 [Streptomyces sp. NPDC087850]|uniref:hypothetical protein n=1 Tax=Streptomyces sp. NPDC087850 TaxID=3365809 RepID=UPI00381C42C9
MSVSAGLHLSRAVSWRLVLATVLAGLLHLLGCAHGPQFSGLPRADTPVAVADLTPVPTGHSVRTTRTVELSERGGAAACTGVDEPAAAGPRAPLPAPPTTGAGVVPAGGARCEPPRSREPDSAGDDRDHAEHSRTRAVLGVWRT